MSVIDRTVAVMAGEESVTICANCRHLFVPTAKAPYWVWLCRANPKPLEFNYLTGGETGEPYRQCRHVNTGGNCEQYEEGINDTSPAKLVPDGHGGMVKMEGNDNGK